MTNPNRKKLSCAWCVLIVGCCGCDTGPRRVPLIGQVSWDGEPMTSGTIVFVPTDGTRGPSTGGSIRAGRYEVAASNGAMPGGTYRVEISALRKTGKTIPSFMVKDAPKFELTENYIPAEYNRQTRLKIVVSDEADQNRFNFLLPMP